MCMPMTLKVALRYLIQAYTYPYLVRVVVSHLIVDEI